MYKHNFFTDPKKMQKQICRTIPPQTKLSLGKLALNMQKKICLTSSPKIVIGPLSIKCAKNKYFKDGVLIFDHNWNFKILFPALNP